MNSPEQSTSIDIDLISKLARIELTEEEKCKLTGQLRDILEYFDQLKEVDVVDVEPIAHAFPIYNIWRNDDIGESFPVAKALLNAPEKSGNQIIVPKMVE
ncbi:MAG: Asp-tRNA(Asn)/Glu-tRNA(Gln) amidotransferase subunit GatC [Puniceicoccales bacterium]|jgi:aspartyl-tRNA(Asn)/glutamyl-tRNA(Gln) amidotransferase subunit C|nr:Asp-tRNA(Asn)/Glu-tRNA(Gln) amidotransferase subunit GatC [Puniceicoccales bacterium]